MATTIITKNGSGAPVAGDLVQGELAVDLTNKTLYSKDSSGNVFKVGDTGGGSPGTFTDLVATNSFTSPGIDDNATSTAITIDANENVGIGTDSPDRLLDVATEDSIIAAFRSTGGASNNRRLEMASGGGKVGLRSFIDTTDAPADMSFSTGSTERMRIDDSGNVGIGTDNPSTALEVNGIARINNYLSINNNGYIRGEYAGELRFQGGTTATTFYDSTNATEHMRISDSGNVGIGTSNPNRTLTVEGASGVPAELVSTSTNSLLAFKDSATGVRPSLGSEGGDLVFNANGERMRIDSSGNVGIGRDGSSYGISYPLDVMHPSNAYMRISSETTQDGAGIIFANQNSTKWTIEKEGVAHNLYIKSDSGVPAVTVTQAGNVGIGTANPDRPLHVFGGYPSVKLERNAGTGAAAAIALTNSTNTAAVITGSDTAMTFRTGDNADTGAGGSEAMRIDSSGRLLVGTSTPAHTSNRFEVANDTAQSALVGKVNLARSGTGYPISGYNCSATGTVNVYDRGVPDYASWVGYANGGIQTFTTTATGTGITSGTAGPYVARGGTDWTASSDRKFKDNLEDIPYGLDAITQLAPVVYDRNDREGASEIGFVAQDVEPVIPHVVTQNDEGDYGIQYARLVPVLTKAIQEQQAMIETLQAEVAALKGA